MYSGVITMLEISPLNTSPNINDWRIKFESQLDDALKKDYPIRDIIQYRALALDQILIHLWDQAGLSQTSLGLFAVGGYGRQEMLPFSDIDLMILSEEKLTDQQQEQVSRFVSNIWDIKQLKPGFSVRTIQECFDEAVKDITITTSLIEARLITGDITLDKYPRRIALKAWNDKDFYNAKMQEQKKRYAQHNNTESNLEPDIKNAPGGLRDINQIGWIAKRHFRVNRIYDLVHLGFLSEFELHLLEQAEDFYWKIRYHLHRLAKRDENRLLFDYQREIATEFGYTKQENHHPNYPIEQFMHRYYRCAQQVTTLNDILLSYFDEVIISVNHQVNIQPFNENFKLIDNKISVVHHKVFSEKPSAILEIFYYLSIDQNIKQIEAKTLRLLVLAAKGIDQKFRDDATHRQIFMKILRESTHLYRTLSEMKRYGILGQYIPAFGQIIGLMQYDLFHIYTVDQHTLLLLRNLERFKNPQFAKDFPIVSSVYQRLNNPDIVLLAALFHDIAKGRGGDHSELGATDAIEFCKNHGFNEVDTHTIAWLIQNHLLMSLTAQKKDISDPDVIQDFAKKVGDLAHLDYLYTLTVADINATNPNLWNTWRASLMRQLYTETRDALRLGLERPIDYQMKVEDTKFLASEHLVHDFPLAQVEAVWQSLGDDYFLKESADEIAWHTRAILEHTMPDQPLVMLRAQRQAAQDAVQLFIYTHDKPNLFATTVAILDCMNLDVQAAKIITANTSFSLDTYIVLDRFGTLLNDPQRQETVKKALIDALSHLDQYPNLIQRRIPRQLRHFDIENKVNIFRNDILQQTVIEISTLDYPGLLARIGGLFMMQGLDIHSAKIATLGERAEDIFFVTKQDRQPLSEDEANIFTRQLKSALDEASNQVTIQH